VEEANGRAPDMTETSDDDTVTIYIDRNSFVVPSHAVTGAMLRQLPSPPIRGDFDLFRIAVGDGEDVLVREVEVVELEDGARFFTAPQMIHAGKPFEHAEGP
jgi:hypothetical protein